MYYILLVRDITEIIFYSSILYAFCSWLKTDKTKNILLYFFAYCSLTLCAWALQLPTLTPFLFSYAPVALLLFIVLHEKTLQRNLVTLRTITPAKSFQENWLDTLLSSSLSIINANKALTVVIENKNSLEPLLITPFFIDATMGREILDILLSSNVYDEQKMVWIDVNGRVRGINVLWLTDKEKTSQKITTFFDKDNSLFYTLNTDAIVFNIHPLSRTFTLIMNGQNINNLSAHQVQALVKKQLYPATPSQQKKGAYRENITTEKSLSQ
jgi:hypothetical protein